MKIHEYQAKRLSRDYSIAVPNGISAGASDKLPQLLGERNDGFLAVKCQIHAGGRGKGTLTSNGAEVGRGVKLVHNKADALEAGQKMLGAKLTTIQTGPAGKTVNTILVEEGSSIAHEYYLGMVIDRDSETIAIMASTEGGTEIEKVASTTPELLHTEFVDIGIGLMPFQARKLGFAMGLSAKQVRGFAGFVIKLYQLFVEKDASLAEINPLVRTEEDAFVALDGKLNFDDNALFRNKDILALRDLSEEEPTEVEADKFNLSYIKLDGNIGCLVNGAGLAMATMDIIKEFGGEPANFLDVGGTATPENVAASFKLMLDDEVEGIFVNVFGGIVRCDVVAQGLVDSLSAVELEVPLVVRLAGNRLAEAQVILDKSGLPIIQATNMEDGARKIVDACRGDK